MAEIFSEVSNGRKSAEQMILIAPNCRSASDSSAMQRLAQHVKLSCEGANVQVALLCARARSFSPSLTLAHSPFFLSLAIFLSVGVSLFCLRMAVVLICNTDVYHTHVYVYIYIHMSTSTHAYIFIYICICT